MERRGFRCATSVRVESIEVVLFDCGTFSEALVDQRMYFYS